MNFGLALSFDQANLATDHHLVTTMSASSDELWNEISLAAASLTQPLSVRQAARLSPASARTTPFLGEAIASQPPRPITSPGSSSSTDLDTFLSKPGLAGLISSALEPAASELQQAQRVKRAFDAIANSLQGIEITRSRKKPRIDTASSSDKELSASASSSTSPSLDPTFSLGEQAQEPETVRESQDPEGGLPTSQVPSEDCLHDPVHKAGRPPSCKSAIRF